MIKFQHNNVTSSNIKSAAYSSEFGMMRVFFHNDTVYEYEGVSHREYNDFLAADSSGSYLAKNIKGNKKCRRVYPELESLSDIVARLDARNFVDETKMPIQEDPLFAMLQRAAHLEEVHGRV